MLKEIDKPSIASRVRSALHNVNYAVDATAGIINQIGLLTGIKEPSPASSSNFENDVDRLMEASEIVLRQLDSIQQSLFGPIVVQSAELPRPR